MGFLIGFLSFVMVVDCVVLVLLVLVQLPKKEAGAGLAFGGSASDALFGAGSGNVLTRITKYSAGIFFALAIVLALMQHAYAGRNTTEFQRGLTTSSQPQPIGALPKSAPAGPGAMPMFEETNAIAKPQPEQPAKPAAGTNAAPTATPSAPK